MVDLYRRPSFACRVAGLAGVVGGNMIGRLTRCPDAVVAVNANVIGNG